MKVLHKNHSMKLKVIIIIFQHSSRREMMVMLFKVLLLSVLKTRCAQFFFWQRLLTLPFYLLFFLQAAPWLLPALLSSVFPLRLSVASWLPMSVCIFHFCLTSISLEFGISSEAASHIHPETFPPWFLWPTFSRSTVPPLCLLWPPLSLSFYLCSVTSLLLLYTLPFDQHPWFLLSPTSWCTPDRQPKPVLTLQIHLLTAAGHLPRECAPRVPFSWIWYDWGPLECIFFTCLPCRHFKFTKAKINLVL